MTSSIVFTNLFDDDDAEDDDIEDNYEENKTREVSVTGLYSVEELFIMMAEHKAGSTEGRDIDDNILNKESTTDSNSNETNLNSVFNRKVKLKPSRPLKHKTVPSTSHDSLDGPSKIEPEFFTADNLQKKHFQDKTDSTFNVGSNCEKSTIKVSDIILRNNGQSPESDKTITLQKIEDQFPRIVTSNKIHVRNHKLVGENHQLEKTKVVIPKHSTTKEEKPKISNLIKVKSEVLDFQRDKLSLPSTVKVTLVEAEAAETHAGDNAVQYKIEKDKIIISQEKLIFELSQEKDKVIRMLATKEEFLNSQQKVIDELRNQNEITLVKVEKLRTELEEKENTTVRLEENHELLKLELKEAKQCLKVSEDNLSSTIAEKEKVLISHQNLVKEHATNIEIVHQKLLQREEFIDSQQRVIDDLESQSVNAHKVEKLENELCEKEKVIVNMKENEAEFACKIVEMKEVIEVENQRYEELNHQLVNLEMDKLSFQKANNHSRLKCSELEKEKEILVETEKAQRKTSEDILKTVEALKIKIDDILISEDQDRNEIKNLQDKIANLSHVNKSLEDQVDSLKANLFTKSGETEMFETALREKEAVCVELKDKISDLTERLQETQKTLDEKTLKVVKMETENGEAKDRFKCMEKEIKAVIKEEIILQKKLDEKLAENSFLHEQEAQSKLELKEAKGRLDLEIDKTIKLIKKLNSSEKLLSSRVKDVELLTDQKILLENEVKALQSSVDEHKKDAQWLSEANVKIKYLEDEKRDLLKEIRNVSDLQKRIKSLEAETKKFNNRKLNDVEEHGTSGSLKKTALGIPDLKDIDDILKRISHNDMKHLESVAAEFCEKEGAIDSPLVHEANEKSTDTGRINIVKAAEETPTVDVSKVTEVQSLDDVIVISSERFKSSHKRKKSSVETETALDSEDDERDRRRHKSKKSKKKKKVSRSEKEENHRGRVSKRRSERSMFSSASRSRSRDKVRSRSRKKVKASSRSRSKSRKHREENHKTKKTSSRSRASPSFRERKRKGSGFSDHKQKKEKSPSPTEKSRTSSSLPMSQGLQPRSKSPVEVNDANFALSKEICSIMEKLKETKADPLPTKKGGNNSACNVAEEVVANIVANYSSELEEISDEEMTLAENCENNEEQTESSYKLESNRSSIDKKKLVESDDVINNKDIEESKVPSSESSHLTVWWSANCSCCGASTEDVKHLEGGECRKKIDWLKQGLPLICAYCTQAGSHWVAACPLLASFCFSCFTWGHTMDTHMEEDSENTIKKLLNTYNRFRTHHHANTGRSEQEKVFPMNSKVDGVWRFQGTLDDVENVSRKLPGHLGKPVSWLLEENWVKLKGLESKKG